MKPLFVLWIVFSFSYVKCQLSADIQGNSISLFFLWTFSAAMSDNVSLAEQTTCIDSESEDDWYNIDIFSHVQSELDENNVSHKQIFLYVTRAGVDRRTFLQVNNLLRELEWYKNVAEFALYLLSTSWVGCCLLLVIVVIMLNADGGMKIISVSIVISLKKLAIVIVINVIPHWAS